MPALFKDPKGVASRAADTSMAEAVPTPAEATSGAVDDTLRALSAQVQSSCWQHCRGQQPVNGVGAAASTIKRLAPTRHCSAAGS